MQVGSLFSGIGGIDLAAERAGMQVTWQAEIDPFACAVLKKRFSETLQVGNVLGMTGDILENIPEIDVLIGGFPCQDVSVAGKRAGLAGARSGLFFQFARIVAERRPRWLLIENVPGLLSSHAGRDMGTVLGTLAQLGYGYAYRVLDAQFFGVPQRRRRVFIVACATVNVRRAAQVLFEPTCGGGNPSSSRAKGQDVAYALAASVRGTGDGHGNAWNTTYVPTVAGSVTTRYAKGPGTTIDDTLITTRPVAVFDPVNVTSRANRTRVEFDSPSYTLHSRGLSVLGPSVGVRRLTPVEAERLQGFPDSWTCLSDHPQPCDCSDGPRYRALGNAVAVPVVEWILRRMRVAETLP